MKNMLILLLIFFPIFAFSQNVGIGTTTPLEKLEVKNPLRSTLRISSTSFNDTTELLLSNRNSSNSGTDFSLKNIEEEGLFFSSLSDLPGNNSSNSLILRPNGNVGIGMLPNYKFHVTGQSRFNGLTQIEGLHLFEFGAGIAGKEISAGKIGYNAFGQNALTFVGAGTNATNRAVYFFAEGGTTMNGPLNIEGPIRINGNSGAAGQILTSNGTGDPAWANAPYGNNIRYAVTFDNSLSSSNDFVRFTNTRYNLNPTEINISTGGITVNKSGLYHFDIFVSSNYTFASPPAFPPVFSISFYNGLASPFEIVSNKIMSGNGTSYVISEKHTLDVYIQSGSVIRLFHQFGLGGGSITLFDGYITGHLISE